MGFVLVALAAYALASVYYGGTGEAGAALAAGLRGAVGLAAGLPAAVVALAGWKLLRGGGPAAGLRAVAAGGFLLVAAIIGAELADLNGGLAGRRLVVVLERVVGSVGLGLAAAVAGLLAASLLLGVGPGGLLALPVLGLRRGVAGLAHLWRVGRGAIGWGIGQAGRWRRLPDAAQGAPPGQRLDGPGGGSGPADGATNRLISQRERAGGWAAELAAGREAEPVPPRPAAAVSSPLVAAPAHAVPGGTSTGAAGGVGPALPSASGGSAAEPGGEGTAALAGGYAGPWKLPGTQLLARPPGRRRGGDDAEIQERSRLLERTLASFGVEARVVSYTRGPTITRYELALPPGIKLSRVVSLADDLALALASPGVRIEAPVGGRPVVGVEVPNARVEAVYLREVLEHPAFARSPAPLALALGKDVAGQPVVGDLERLIHLLIAGATGSGKSVCLASIIMSLLYRLGPDRLRLLLVDPKRVELTVYEGVPHLLAPVVTEVKQAALALRWAVREMEARYQQLSRAGARHLAAYNQMAARGQVEAPLPYLVVVIDELADLMMAAPAEVEDSICRLAQMARAAGIHLVIATQRPSTDVITGLIKANIPSRLAFAVSSQVDSRTILDMGGAERLLGRGDMLYHPLGEPKPVRAQGCLVTERDVEQVVRYWKAQGAPQYVADVFAEAPTPGESADEEDDLYDEAVRLVTQAGQASVSLLQRRFRIGYARAARLIDLMEQRGVVGPYQGSKPREVRVSPRGREHPA